VVERRVTVDYRWGEVFLVVIRNVPAGVCQVCGERYFKADVIKRMEHVARSKKQPKTVIEVPVRQLELV
jgi:YgiT-type zinc finger domain-containing protein